MFLERIFYCFEWILLFKLIANFLGNSEKASSDAADKLGRKPFEELDGPLNQRNMDV